MFTPTDIQINGHSTCQRNFDVVPISLSLNEQTACNSLSDVAVCDHEDGAHVAPALPYRGQEGKLPAGATQHAGQRRVALHASVAATSEAAAAALEAAEAAEEDGRGGRVGAGAVRRVAACEIGSRFVDMK